MFFWYFAYFFTYSTTFRGTSDGRNWTIFDEIRGLKGAPDDEWHTFVMDDGGGDMLIPRTVNVYTDI